MWDMNEIKKMQTDMRESKKNLLMTTLAEKHKNTMVEDAAKYKHETGINDATISAKAGVNEATAKMYNSEAGKADAEARKTRLSNELTEGLMPNALASGKASMGLDTLANNAKKATIMESALAVGRTVDPKTGSVGMNPLVADKYEQQRIANQTELAARKDRRAKGIKEPTDTMSKATPATQSAIKTITPVPGPVITGGDEKIKKYGPLSPSAAKKDKIFN